jgi:hypothetical protein
MGDHQREGITYVVDRDKLAKMPRRGTMMTPNPLRRQASPRRKTVRESTLSRFPGEDTTAECLVAVTNRNIWLFRSAHGLNRIGIAAASPKNRSERQ